MHKGRIIPVEVRQRISNTLKGRKLSNVHRENISKAQTGVKYSEYHRRRISEGKKGRPSSLKGRKMPNRSGVNHWRWQGGKPKCLDCGKQLNSRKAKHCSTHANLRIAKKGTEHWNWQGGITGWQHKIRTSFEYKLWRTAVFERDKYSCVWCGQTGGDIHADHIKPFAYYPELRFAIDNGRTLCKSCHKKTDTYGYHLINITKKT